MNKPFKKGIIAFTIIFSFLFFNKANAFSFSDFSNNFTISINKAISALDNIINSKTTSNTISNIISKIASSTEINISTTTDTFFHFFSTSTNSTNPILGDIKTGNLKLTTNEIIYWTNISRNNNGNLSALVEDATLDKIAQKRVDDMFANSYFEHVSPSGDNAAKEATSMNYEYIMIGENLALGNFNSSRSLVQAWMDSPGHRANILDAKFTNIGVATKEGMYDGQKVSISAQIFSRPLSLCTKTDASLKNKLDSYQKTISTLKPEIDSLALQIKNSTSTANMKNEKILQYNSLVKGYNNLVNQSKSLAGQYNKEVNSYNNCIKVD